jgi:taurine dioxygenase
MEYTRIHVEPLATAAGAEITGVDVSAPLDDSVIDEIHRAFLAHGAIFFRDQNLSPDQYLRFARAMGEPSEYPFVTGLEGYPEITEVVKEKDERLNFGGVWHSDTTYLERPPMGTILYAREIPSVGGDTIFASMTAAYEALSPGMRRMLEGLSAVNSADKGDAAITRADARRQRPKDEGDTVTTSEHPVVRTHPETGRKAIYVNPGHTLRISGLTEAESTPILDYLFQHQKRPEFTCRFRWRVGSLAFWDNRAVQHYPLNDYHGHRRAMQRITLAGDRPR